MPYTAATNAIVGMAPVVVGAHVVKGIAGGRKRRTATRRKQVTKRRPVARKATNTKRKRRR